MTIRTRFAPSPTGEPHIGNIRTALFAWLFAKSRGGDFILRIEDTDKSRETAGAVEAILESLAWLGLDYDNSASLKHKNIKTIEQFNNFKDIYFQSQRLPIYQHYAEELVKKGYAYICICSEERLKSLRQDQIANRQPPMYDGRCRNQFPISNFQVPSSVIRLKVPQEGKTIFNDLIRGQINFENKLIDDQVLLKSDGFPTYHLANVVDDYLMGITHVIRAEEWLSSTPKHLLLYKFLGWQPPQFAHLPMILGSDKAKLSKRHGATSILEYKRQGYLPEAIINYLALLGWRPNTNQEIFNRQELISQFTLERAQKSPAIFDQEKLDWLNGYYIRQLKVNDLLDRLMEYGKNHNADIVKLLNCLIIQDNKIRRIKIVKLVQDRMRTLGDFIELSKFIVQLPDYDSSLLIFKKSNKDEIKQSLTTALKLLQNIEESEFMAENLSSCFKQKIEAENLPIGQILHPLRVALTGQQNSPGPFETAETLGKKEAIRRVKLALEKI